MPDRRLAHVLAWSAPVGWLTCALIAATIPLYFTLGIGAAGWLVVVLLLAVLGALHLGSPSARPLAWIGAFVVLARSVSFGTSPYGLMQAGPVEHLAGFLVEPLAGLIVVAVLLRAALSPTPQVAPAPAASGTTTAAAAVVEEPFGGVWGKASDAAAGTAPIGRETITDPNDPWRRATPKSDS